MSKAWVANTATYLRHNKIASLWIVILAAIWLVALFAPLVATHEPLKQSADLLQPPSASHWMGTDEFGRDLFSRIVYGGRISLSVGIIAVAIAVLVGSTLGLLSGYVGGLIDTAIMRFIDGLMAFPSIILAILIMAVLGPSLVNLMIAVGISAVPWYARTVRGSTLQVKQTQYVESSQAVGAGTLRIIWRHILPNVAAPIIVLGTLGMATSILAIAGLSFLGLGARPPSPEWGAMLSSARTYMGRASWYATFPGVAIMISVLAMNIIGDALRDILDPRLRGSIGVGQR